MRSVGPDFMFFSSYVHHSAKDNESHKSNDIVVLPSIGNRWNQSKATRQPKKTGKKHSCSEGPGNGLDTTSEWQRISGKRQNTQKKAAFRKPEGRLCPFK